MAERKRKAELKIVQNCIKDLQDDSSAITGINKAFLELGEDLRNALECEKTNSIVTTIENMEESYQYSDSDLSKAIEALNNEAKALQKEIEAEEEAERVAREAKRMMVSW